MNAERCTTNLRVCFETTIKLSEVECRALHALTVYGHQSFLKTFKDQLGSSDIRTCEDGVKTLFATIARDVGPALDQIDWMRKALIDAERERKLEIIRRDLKEEIRSKPEKAGDE